MEIEFQYNRTPILHGGIRIPDEVNRLRLIAITIANLQLRSEILDYTYVFPIEWKAK